MLWYYIALAAFAVHVTAGFAFWWWVRVDNPAASGAYSLFLWCLLWPFIIGLVACYATIILVQYTVDTGAEQCCLLSGRFKAWRKRKRAETLDGKW